MSLRKDHIQPEHEQDDSDQADDVAHGSLRQRPIDLVSPARHDPRRAQRESEECAARRDESFH